MSDNVTCPECKGEGTVRYTKPDTYGFMINETWCNFCDGYGKLSIESDKYQEYLLTHVL